MNLVRSVQSPLLSRTIATVVALSCFAATAVAHPGHALGQHGAAHVMASPYHLGMLAAAGVGLIGAARLLQGVQARRVLQAAGACALGLAGALLLLGA